MPAFFSGAEIFGVFCWPPNVIQSWNMDNRQILSSTTCRKNRKTYRIDRLDRLDRLDRAIARSIGSIDGRREYTVGGCWRTSAIPRWKKNNANCNHQCHVWWQKKWFQQWYESRDTNICPPKVGFLMGNQTTTNNQQKLYFSRNHAYSSFQTHSFMHEQFSSNSVRRWQFSV